MKLGVNTKIFRHSIENNINCFNDIQIYKEIQKKVFKDFPLLSYRAWKFENRLFSKENLKEYIKIHQKNLNSH